MLSLIMDTSNQYLLVALYENGQCLNKIQELGSQRQSENAIPYLERLLQQHHKELKDVDEMIITRGPGSYTGVRVAMTIAKTLSVITNIKIKVLSSLAVYAGQNDCISVIDARSHKVFVCAYHEGKPLFQEQLLELDDFQQIVKKYEGYQVVGQTDVVNYPQKEIDLAQNMYELSQTVQPIEHVDALVPIYLKDVEAKQICL